MMFRLITAAAVFGHFASAHPYSHANSILANSLTERASYTVTTGASGGVQPRYEIRQMQNQNPQQWDLFILALRHWMDTDKGDATGDGYYGIAGIHGVPEVSWGGVEECQACSQGSDSAYGYCMHASVAFPGWHRAYLALFEQLLVENAVTVAQSYSSNQDQWVAAAQSLRLPFWDWAAKAPDGQMFPPVFTQQTITVNGPNGQESIANPLFQYGFDNPAEDNPYTPFNQWPDTLRYPNGQGADAGSQESLASNYLNGAQESLQEQVYNLLSNCPDWQSFSNTNGGSAQCAMSLEGIHNRIHSLVGGVPTNGQTGGHMAYLPVAAFDAAFWIHHANVDRIFAMWQTLNPNSYGASQPIGFTTWTYPSGAVQDANSALTPFYSDSNGNFHTLNSVRNWAQTFNYQYPEYMSTDGSADSIRAIVAAYYGPNATMTAGKVPISSGGGSRIKRAGSSSGLTALSTLSTASMPAFLGGFFGAGNQAAGTEQEQYVANIVANNNALNSTYTVCVFNNAPTVGNGVQCELDPNYIGSVVMMSHGHQSHAQTTGAVPLTFFLQKQVNKGEIKSMSPGDVLPWLNDHLQWRIVGSNGVVPCNQVPGFALSVYSSTSQIPTQGALPVWSPVQPQLDVTKGKLGGATTVPDFVTNILSGLL